MLENQESAQSLQTPADKDGAYAAPQLTYSDSEKNEFFSTPGTHGLVQQLIYLAQFCDGIAVVQGVLGSGKTTLLAELERQLASRIQIARVGVSEGDDLAFTIESMVSQLGLGQGGSVGELLAELRSFHSALVHEKKAMVLLIDDAHHLSDESLAAIVSLVDGTDVGGSGLHLLFFGLPGIVSRIDDLGLIDAPVYDFDMPLFSRAELEQFLVHVQSQGGSKAGGLAPENLTQLWSSSQGIPGVALAQLLASAKHEHAIGSPHSSPDSDVQADSSSVNTKRAKGFLSIMPVAHGAALLVLVLVLVWAIIMREESPGGAESRSLAGAPLPAPLIMSNDNIQPDGWVDSSRLVDVIADEHNEPKENQRLEIESKSESVTFVAGSESVPQAATEKDDEALDPQSMSSEKVIDGKITDRQAVDEQALKELVAQMQGSDPLAIKPAAPEQYEPAVSRPKPAPSVAIESVPVNGENAILRAPNSYYTLQVLAASQDESLKRYIQRQTNSRDLYLYQGLRQGKQWYVVVAGLYRTRELAIEGILSLPEEQRKAGPWPRRVGDVKAEIEANTR